MIFSSLLIMASQFIASDYEPTYSEQEIVVIGNRLRSISVSIGQDQKRSYYCSLSDSTGYSKLDNQMCKAMIKCVQKGSTGDAKVKKCIAKTKSTLVKRLKRKARNKKI